MPDNTLSTLEQIRIKIRRLTRSPSSSQITNDQIDDYVNTFILYDFPEHLRTNYLRKTFAFYTNAHQDVYESNDIVGDDFNNFKNEYISLHGPVYIAGYQALFSQSRQEFFDQWPKTVSIKSVRTGDGFIQPDTGTLTGAPLLKNNVLFSSIDAFEDDLKAYDDGAGNLIGNVIAGGTINYLTGAYAFTYTTGVKAGQSVDSQTVQYQAARPNSLLFYENKLTVRPIPDQAYKVEIEAYVRPTEFLSATPTQQPELAQWSQWIAYGAAKKVFEDRMDMESVQLIMPEYRKQESLVNRRTIMQLSNERVSTIYDGQTNPVNKIGGF
jgi:hypothetical protein